MSDESLNLTWRDSVSDFGLTVRAHKEFGAVSFAVWQSGTNPWAAPRVLLTARDLRTMADHLTHMANKLEVQEECE